MAENASNKAVASNQMTTAVLTNLGKRLLDEAYQSGNKITIAEMSLGDSNHAYVEPNPAFTELVHEFGRQAINEGNTQETWINAIVYVDAKRWKGNSIFEFGLHDADGNLIVYSSYPATTIPEDGSEHVQIEIECYLDLYNASAVSITITPIMQIASELEAGIARVATKAQVLEGVSDNTIVTPKKLRDTQQFQLYNPDRLYKAGEICFTQSAETGESSYWQWYSNVESLAGKSPLLESHRHIGWTDNTKPFYWVPYTGDQVGMPFYWLDTSAPEWAVMEINVDLPIAVYWRLARCYPSLVFNKSGIEYINTGEIRAEFIRVLDQGRGIDSGRLVNSFQDHQFEDHSHNINGASSQTPDGTTGNYLAVSDISVSNPQNYVTGARQGNRGSETRPRNIARPIAIAI